MKRTIIHIDAARCNGCGLCAQACHEGAIGMKDGKAVLLRDDYCDGLGDCLPVCPTGAISFVEREAAPYDEAAVRANMQAAAGGCPGMRARTLAPMAASAAGTAAPDQPSALAQWPVQIKLAPVNAPYFRSAKLLIAADCTAYAYANFHQRFMQGQVTLIGCPKLDAGDYADKLTDILAANDIEGITVVRMEVPCCGGIERAAAEAIQRSGKAFPWQVVTLSTDGQILSTKP